MRMWLDVRDSDCECSINVFTRCDDHLCQLKDLCSNINDFGLQVCCMPATCMQFGHVLSVVCKLHV